MVAPVGVAAGQGIGQHDHVQAEDFFALPEGFSGDADQGLTQLHDRQASIEGLLAQLQNLLGEPFAIQRGFIEKTLHLLAMSHGLGLQAFQRGLCQQRAALLLKQLCTGLILVGAGANQRAHDCQQAKSAQQGDTPLEGEMGWTHGWGFLRGALAVMGAFLFLLRHPRIARVRLGCGHDRPGGYPKSATARGGIGRPRPVLGRGFGCYRFGIASRSRAGIGSNSARN